MARTPKAKRATKRPVGHVDELARVRKTERPGLRDAHKRRDALNRRTGR